MLIDDYRLDSQVISTNSITPPAMPMQKHHEPPIRMTSAHMKHIQCSSQNDFQSYAAIAPNSTAKRLPLSFQSATLPTAAALDSCPEDDPPAATLVAVALAFATLLPAAALREENDGDAPVEEAAPEDIALEACPEDVALDAAPEDVAPEDIPLEAAVEAAALALAELPEAEEGLEVSEAEAAEAPVWEATVLLDSRTKYGE